jgi:hypothetical protein
MNINDYPLSTHQPHGQIIVSLNRHRNALSQQWNEVK